MSHLVVVIVTLWMTSSAVQLNTVDSLLTSANSLLAKFIKVPPLHSQPGPPPHPSESTVSPLSSHLSATNAAGGYRIEIPVYEPIGESAWNAMKPMPHAAMSDTSPAISGYRYWTYGKVPPPPPQYAPVPALLDYHYQSPAWTAALFSTYMNDHLPHELLDSSHHQWSSAAPSYQHPFFLTPPSAPSPTTTVSKSPPGSSTSTATGLYLIGKTKNYFIPPPNAKVASGQLLPLSLVGLSNAGPHEMLAMSEDRRYEVRHPEHPDKYHKHYFNDQNAFYHQQMDHFDSSADPFAETRTFEHYQQTGSPHHGDQSHFYHQQTPQMSSIFDQYPYYLEDTFNNFASLLDRTPQKIYSGINDNANTNWPHKSKYEPVNAAKNDTTSASFNKMIYMPNNKVDTNCTTKRPDLAVPAKFQFNDTPFRPILPGMGHGSAYFESLRKRTGLLDSGNNKHDPKHHQQQLQDSLITANSVNRQTKIKMNNFDEKYADNTEGEDTGAEYDKSKSGENESNLDADKEYSSASNSDDSGDNGEGSDANHDKERMQYLKDKGYAKHGWKNVYHKEEWGEQKKYHDIWRFKDWKDRFAEKSVSASHPRPVIAMPNSNSTSRPATPPHFKSQPSR